MEGHLWKQVQSLPSFSDVLKLSYLQRASESDKQTILLDDQRCKKCQSFWTNGQFSLKIKPANQKRKLRRKHLIKKYSVIIKESLNQKYIKNLKKIIQRLQRLNNHWAVRQKSSCYLFILMFLLHFRFTLAYYALIETRFCFLNQFSLSTAVEKLRKTTLNKILSKSKIRRKKSRS